MVVDAFNRSMILYAEHSFNASMFTARVITSTLSVEPPVAVRSYLVKARIVYLCSNIALTELSCQISMVYSMASWSSRTSRVFVVLSLGMSIKVSAMCTT